MKRLKAPISVIDKSLTKVGVRLVDFIYIAKVVNECILAARLRHSASHDR